MTEPRRTGPDRPGEGRSEGQGRIYIVRHGESVWNVEGRHQGQSLAAPGLTERGRAHAVAVAATLADSGATVLLTSDLRRAVETAQPLAQALDVAPGIEPRLRERSFGTIEGRLLASVDPGEVGVTGDVVTDPEARPPAGESIRELYDRVVGLLHELIERPPAPCIVLVSHGGPMRVVRAYLTGTAVDAMSWAPVANGAIFEIPFDLPESG